MLTELDILEINNILKIIGQPFLNELEIEYLNAIYDCQDVTIPCFWYAMTGKILQQRNIVCGDSQINKLQEISDCKGCTIDFISELNQQEAQVIWGGSVNVC